MTNDFLGKREVNPNESVCHVSFYEADAYSKWAGKRLPTEAEWEKAACWDEKTQTKTIFPWGDKQPDINMANLLESYLWNCTEIGAYPNGKSHYGCQQMIGDVWEWTSSEFTGYPGFKSGFSEYNDKWFANQKVLRGGSFGTPSISVRGSYRNFFRLDERWLFSGFRCAEDI
jgi:formylglycine-generating enzyme required for sulfatase activity